MATRDYTDRADDEAIRRTVDALRSRGIEATVVNSGEEANRKLLEMVPEGAEIFDHTSETLDSIGFTGYIKKTLVTPTCGMQSKPKRRRRSSVS